MRQLLNFGAARTLMVAAFIASGTGSGLEGAEASKGGPGNREKGVVRLYRRAERRLRPEGAPNYSDVSMRLFVKRENDAEIKAGKAFHITRGDWSYLYGVKDKAAYIRKVKELGWSFQGATNAVTNNPDHAMKNRDGSPMLDHFGKPGRYWADMNNEDYRKWYVEQLKQWVECGADSIQRDEPLTCGRTPVRTAVAFFKDVHARLEKQIGKKVPFSCNMKLGFAYGGREPVNRLFDFGMAEFYRQYLNPTAIAEASRDAERRGKTIIYTGGAPLSNGEIRCAIAGCYANGVNYIVPWDQFTGIGRPRLFSKPEDFADLYGFVRAVATHLDGYERAAEVVPVALRTDRIREQLANDLFAGRAFTVVMVTKSDENIGVGGNSANGSGGIPRLYMVRGGFHYNVLDKAIPTGTQAGEVEITTFVHDGKNRITAYRNGEKAGARADDDHAAVNEFGGGVLSIPFNGANLNQSGDFAELFGFRGELPARRLAALHAALKAKYLDGGSREGVIPDNLLGPELTLHLSAEDLAKTHKPGTAVTTWPARTGQTAMVPNVRLHNGNQASAPVFLPEAVNGRPAVRFDGVGNLMRIVDARQPAGVDPFAVAPGTGSGRLCIFARAKPDDADAPVVLHLVEWYGTPGPKPATIVLQPEAFFGERPLRVTLLAPPPYDKTAHQKAQAEQDYGPLAVWTELPTAQKGGRVHVEVPALRPWGIMLVAPAD
jgi:hypothetical protein